MPSTPASFATAPFTRPLRARLLSDWSAKMVCVCFMYARVFASIPSNALPARMPSRTFSQISLSSGPAVSESSTQTFLPGCAAVYSSAAWQAAL